MSAGKDKDGGDRVAEFSAFRKRMNERILAEDNQVVRRFFALDTQTYRAGALDVKTKELMGLAASMVLAVGIAWQAKLLQHFFTLAMA